MASDSQLSSPELALLLRTALRRSGRWLFLTGAGISAESGVPTFRGRQGYWRVGSRNYHPQERDEPVIACPCCCASCVARSRSSELPQAVRAR
jgi:hypothetical protein